jgi:hypothetical protein
MSNVASNSEYCHVCNLKRHAKPTGGREATHSVCHSQNQAVSNKVYRTIPVISANLNKTALP